MGMLFLSNCISCTSAGSSAGCLNVIPAGLKINQMKVFISLSLHVNSLPSGIQGENKNGARSLKAFLKPTLKLMVTKSLRQNKGIKIFWKNLH